MDMTIALKILNKRLLDQLTALSDKAKDVFLATNAGTKRAVSYQIIPALDNEIHLTVFLASDGKHSTSPYPDLDAAKITSYITAFSRKGNLLFAHGFDPEAENNILLDIDASAKLDDMTSWLILIDAELTRITGASTFPATNITTVDKQIKYEFDQTGPVNIAVSGTQLIALDPVVTTNADDENHWVSDNINIATVTDWVEATDVGGLVTGVAPGQVYIRNNKVGKILINVTP